MKPEGIIEQDLTGDGQADLIINVGSVECDETRNYGCGTLGCPTFFYVRQGDRLIENLYIATVWGVSVGEGEPPVITLSGRDVVEQRQWNGETFAEPASQNLPQTAGRWQYDPTWGFIGRAIIQGEQGSTLGVGCDDNGFPALHLLNANAPEKATLNFELDGVPVQRYPVDCGGNNHCTIEAGFQDSLALTRGLMARNTLTVTWNRQLIDRYSLAGSSAAISQLGARDCEL